MRLFIIFYLVLIINFLNASLSSEQQTKKSNKHYEKHDVYKHGSCSKFDNTLHVMNITRKFIGLNNDNLALLKYFDSDDIQYRECSSSSSSNNNNNNHDLIPIKFRYQFIETLHCIRVEIDLGNTTKFRQMTNFNYYMFNYREIAKKNTYLERQPINESVNSLTIYKAHLRPYIICVSFYKNKMESNKAINLTQNDCNEYNDFITKDERFNDIDLCIDIDTQLHFLSAPIEHHKRFNGIDPELLMVIFIICLLAVILLIITIGHKLIERPKKKRILQQLRHRLYNNQKKAHDTPENQSGLINSSSQAIFKDAKLMTNNGPTITITDCSSTHAFNKYEDEPKETDAMLRTDYTPPLFTINNNNNSSNDFTHNGNNNNNNNNNHKVTFVIGETIFEEPSVLNDSILVDSTDTDNNNANNEEAIKSVSHLLDDKPWITSAPAPSSSNRISRANSLTGSSTMMHKDQ